MATDEFGFKSHLQNFGSTFRQRFEETKALIYQLKAVSYSEKSTDFSVHGTKCFGENPSDFRRNLDREISEDRVQRLQRRNLELSDRLSVNETIIERFVQLVCQLQNDFEKSLRETAEAEDKRIKENKEAASKFSKLECQLQAHETTVKIKDDEIKKLNGKISDLQVTLSRLEKDLKEAQKERNTLNSDKEAFESKLQRLKDNLKDTNSQNQKLSIENQKLLDEDRRTKKILEQIEETHKSEMSKAERRIEEESRRFEAEVNGIRSHYEAELAEKVAAVTTRWQAEIEKQRKIHEAALKKAKDQTDELMKYRDKYVLLLKKYNDSESEANRKVLEALNDAKMRVMMEQAANNRNVLANRQLHEERPQNLANVFLNDFRGSEASSCSSSTISEQEENRFGRRSSIIHPAQKRHRAASETRAKQPRVGSNLYPQIVTQSQNPSKRPPFRT
ncbi:unnamed protein product [Bursaphelenchus xylophilus]|uniref:(pine wood nematode) hypothetical protein n=1 Tax=Bursaphelenchus xylophilus TaxID=6326 RepID=A0A1I7SAK3_BURXY|nr:unnamed protein product [Bursaphelenchus xylophilus]CAG9079281.1 unnamed protein product [Bursaphelenchus xylophilus]